MELETLGYSDRGHPISALSLTGQEAPGTLARSDRPRVRVQGGVGGDKKSPYVLLNLLGILANYYGQHEDITDTLNRARVTFIPVLEPDLQFTAETPEQSNPASVSVKRLIDAALTPSGGIFRDEKKWVKGEAAKESSEDEESEEDDNTTDADRRARAFRKRKAAPGWGQAGEFMQNCACVKKCLYFRLLAIYQARTSRNNALYAKNIRYFSHFTFKINRTCLVEN